MTLVFASSGESRVLEYLLNKQAQENLIMGFFVNSWLPSKATAITSLVEAAGGGYARLTLPNPSSWSVVASNANGLAEATYDVRSIIFTASIGPVEGYFMVGTTTGRYMYAEKFSDGPYLIVRSGDQINVLPRIIVNSI